MKKQIKSQEEKHISKEEKVLLDQSLDDFKRGKTISHKKMMEFLKGSQPQEEWEKEFDKLCEKKVYVPYVVGSNCGEEVCDIHLDDIKLFIKNLISKIRKEERELIIRIIEEEKEVIFNSEKFYNGGEEVFGLLLKIQEKIKHL